MGGDAAVGQGWMYGARMHLWGRDGSVGQRCICGAVIYGAGMHLWGRDGFVGQESMGQGCICGAGMDLWDRDGSMGQGWICGAGMDLWGMDASLGRVVSVGQGWIYGAESQPLPPPHSTSVPSNATSALLEAYLGTTSALSLHVRP